MFEDLRSTYIYILDGFKKLPISFSDILEAWEEDRMKPFKLVRKDVEEELGRILGVKLYGAYFNPEKMVAVIEYMVEFQGKGSSGVYGVKIVHAEYPELALIEYYKAEKEGKLVK